MYASDPHHDLLQGCRMKGRLMYRSDGKWFVLQVRKMMNSVVKTRNSVSKTRNFVSKTRNFVLKMMNFAEHAVQPDRDAAF